MTRADTCMTLLAGCVHWEGEQVAVEIDAGARSQLLEMWKVLSAGSADYKCSVRAVSMLLWQLYRDEKVTLSRNNLRSSLSCYICMCTLLLQVAGCISIVWLR